jgi:SHS2 domain-containing protein
LNPAAPPRSGRRELDVPHESAGGFVEQEHPSDALLSIHAPSLPGLFAAAARACFEQMTDLSRVLHVEVRRFECEAPDVEELLVVWLNELIGASAVERLLFSGFEIEEASETRVVASARGERVDPARHVLRREVKAATYHRLSVASGPSGWSATVLLDI